MGAAAGAEEIGLTVYGLDPGKVVSFAPGAGGAPQLINRSDDVARFEGEPGCA